MKNLELENINLNHRIATFIKEGYNRFICEVMIENNTIECYVSSSSKLSHFIPLENRKVLIRKNEGKKLRTKYTLQAVWEDQNKSLLNLNYLNNVFENYLDSTDWKREYIVNKNLKTDFINIKENKLIEVKGILSEEKTTLFPIVYSERAIKQLKEYNKLLKKGFKVEYALVFLNENSIDFTLNKEEKIFCKAFKSCLKNGMTVNKYQIKWNNYTPYIERI